MCGIIFSTLSVENSGTVENSFNLIKYRGPDNTTIMKHDDGYFFGHHRLNIIEIESPETGNQPIIRDDITLVCNGEIYNYRDINTNVKSDCEVIIDTYKADKLHELDGDFAFVLYDSEKCSLVIGRDPVGLKPLFCYMNDEDVIVCSEMKVIEDLLKKNNIDFGEDSIKSVPINSITTIDMFTKIIDIKQLTDIFEKTCDEDCKDFDEYETCKTRVKGLLVTAVRKRLEHTNKPVALLCSGGIDSTIISLIGCALEPESEIFTMEYFSGTSMDSFYADMFAKSLDLKHHTVVYGQGLCDGLWRDPATKDLDSNIITEVIRVLETSDPNTIRAAVPMYLLAKHIAENTDYRVILSGEGADELFMGYNYFPICGPTSEESRRLVRNLHSFDILRAERCFSAHGLELRVPFLDRDLIKYVLNIPAKFRNTIVEKQLLRDAFRDSFMKNQVPLQILDRVKERFSDGVGLSWVPDLINAICSLEWCNNGGTKNPYPKTTNDRLETEKGYYKKVYNKLYKTVFLVPREMPDWADKHTVKEQNVLDTEAWPCEYNKHGEVPVTDNDFDTYLKNREDIVIRRDTDAQKIVSEKVTTKVSFLEINELISELLHVMSEDMLDKTKCSVTSRNVFNYVISKYHREGHVPKQIAWNDTLQGISSSTLQGISSSTLQENYVTLSQMISMCGDYSLENQIAYVYYDHLCGYTSHYFIMIFNGRQEFYLLQSAVFEYSLACWTFNISPEDYNLLTNGLVEGSTDDYIKTLSDADKIRYKTLVKINNNIPARQSRNTIEFLYNLLYLEGPTNNLLDNGPEYCELFEKLFACDIAYEKFAGVLREESMAANKVAQFRFRLEPLCTVL
jgi:asparagine synthase (glutamine-hydrolysing)